MRHCATHGWTRVALIGKSDLTEITILSAAELHIKLIGIIDADAAITTSSYMNLPVVSEFSDLNSVNALIITDMEKPQKIFDEAIEYLPQNQVLTVSLLGIKREHKGESYNTASSVGDIK